jgi:nitrate reductase gamma subunit
MRYRLFTVLSALSLLVCVSLLVHRAVVGVFVQLPLFVATVTGSATGERVESHEYHVSAVSVALAIAAMMVGLWCLEWRRHRSPK